MVWALIVVIIFIICVSLLVLSVENFRIKNAKKHYQASLETFRLDPKNEFNKNELIQAGMKFARMAEKKSKKGDALIFNEHTLQHDMIACMADSKQSPEKNKNSDSARDDQKKTTIPFQRDIFKEFEKR